MNGTLSEHPPGAPEDWTLATCPLSLGRAVNKHCGATAEGSLGSRAAGGGRGPAEGTLSPLGPSAHVFANHLAAQAPVALAVLAPQGRCEWRLTRTSFAPDFVLGQKYQCHPHFTEAQARRAWLTCRVPTQVEWSPGPVLCVQLQGSDLWRLRHGLARLLAACLSKSCTW